MEILMSTSIQFLDFAFGQLRGGENSFQKYLSKFQKVSFLFPFIFVFQPIYISDSEKKCPFHFLPSCFGNFLGTKEWSKTKIQK